MAGDLVEDQVAKAEVNGGGNELGDSIEAAFEGKPVPKWGEQITIRAMVVSALLGVMFSVIVMKLNLTTGIIPSLNVAAGLLGFFFIKSYTKVLEKLGFLKQPFTRQENTVIQTCVVACYGIAFSGGFGSYLFGMSSKVANGEKEGNDPFNIKDPQLGWIIGFLFLVSFLGLFSIVPLRKIMIIDYKLTYPSGTATAYLINGFHTPEGAKLAKKQVGVLGRFFSFSFLWGFFQWFFAAGDGCGFSSFPTFGLKAYANRFYFDFSATYVGVGMICPYMVNISLLLGAILSWGIMWPSIISKSGDWYPSGTPARSLSGIQGYRVFIAIAFILGDGLYNFVKVTLRTIKTFMKQTKQEGSSIIPISGGEAPGISFDEHRRNDVFMRNGIKNLYAVAGYVILAIISIIVVPHIFPQLKWYHVLVTYIIAPVLAFCNAYGCGLTDWSLASTYGKLAIFIFGAWAGKDHGGILAGLASCGVMMSIVSTASDLMQDFKTGYLTLASPRSMFVSQVVGTAMGCIIAPSVFWLFYKAFDIGNPDGEYAAPFANLYRSIAILGVEGLSALPKNCLSLCLGFFIAAFLINLAKDLLPKKVSKFVPIPMAMAIPFYIGGYFAIDMCLGSLILFIWERKNKVQADQFGPAVASGLICGDGIWSLPTAFLSLAKIQAPVCMNFLSRTDYAKVTSLLNS